MKEESSSSEEINGASTKQIQTVQYLATMKAFVNYLFDPPSQYKSSISLPKFGG